MRRRGVQNGVWCSTVRAGRGIETPLAERDSYTGTGSVQGLSRMSLHGVQNGDRQLKM